MRFLDVRPGEARTLPAHGALSEAVHVFDERMIAAIDAALAADRPLLVRGEPGTGKSQLARAAAVALGRVFLPFTVDARTESRDLLYSVDTVARLAESQIVGFLKNSQPALDVRAHLAEKNFTSPGPLWWVFDWQGATDQATVARSATPWSPQGWTPENGAVLLLDEIDKADPAVPNGLLEALGLGQFPTPWGDTVSSQSAVPPLVVITTNEERSLPDAFVRRCLVLQLGWPIRRDELIAALIARGRAHFPAAAENLLATAAGMVADDREAILDRHLNPPGGAEYLDLLRAVIRRHPDDPEAQKAGLDRIRSFALRKHPEEREG